MNKSTKKGSVTSPVHSNILRPRQIKALSLILEGMPLHEVAQQVGVSRQTVSEWKNHHPAFKAKLECLRMEADEELHFVLPMNEGFMISQLRKVAQEAPPEIRLKAIQYFFERFARSELDTHADSTLLHDGSDMLQRVLKKIRTTENQ